MLRKKISFNFAPDDGQGGGDGGGSSDGGTDNGGDAGGSASIPDASTSTNSDPVSTPANWQDNLPESVRGWEEVKNSDSSDKFFDQMTNMRSAMGASIRIPGEDASDEVKAEFRQKLMTKVPGLVQMPGEGESMDDMYVALGRPEEISGYTAPEIEGAGVSPERFGQLAAVAHKYGLSKAQLEGMANDIFTADAVANAEVVQANADALGGLKGEWGGAFEERSGMAKTILAKFFPHFDPTHMSADDMRGFHTLAKQLGTESSQALFQGSSEGALVPAEIEIKISEVRGNKNHPYHNPNDPGHAAAKKQMSGYYELLNPED